MLGVQAAIAAASEARRRRLPLHVSLIMLAGGLGTTILHSVSAIVWSAAMVIFLIADAELYRRLERDEISVSRFVLPGWAVLIAGVFAYLPGALLRAGPWGAVVAVLTAGIALVCLRAPTLSVLWGASLGFVKYVSGVSAMVARFRAAAFQPVPQQ